MKRLLLNLAAAIGFCVLAVAISFAAKKLAEVFQ